MSEVSAHGLLTKFEFYFVALIFTILGLALQTASLDEAADTIAYMEVSAWVGLMASGLVGLSKVKWITSIVMVRNRKEFLSDMSRQINITRAQGQTHVLDSSSGEQVPIPEILQMISNNEKKADQGLLRLGKVHEIKEHVQWWSFVISLLLLGGSRGIAALS